MNTEPTMTLNDACTALRANFISISEPKLAAALEAGRLPFGFAVRGTGEKGKVTTVISRHKFYTWMDDFLGYKAIRV